MDCLLVGYDDNYQLNKARHGYHYFYDFIEVMILILSKRATGYLVPISIFRVVSNLR